LAEEQTGKRQQPVRADKTYSRLPRNPN
jgi:hypothetical protein